MPGTVVTKVGRPPVSSVNANSAPAGLARRPSGRILVPSGSTPTYLAASPLGALAVHLPFTTAGGVIEPHSSAWGIVDQSSRLGQW